jgi:putative ABC transport system ATP-binding protein
VYVGGRPTGALREPARAAVRRDTVGIVFQDFQLVPDLTARENTALPQEHAGATRDPAWLDELFDRLDIADLAGQYPATLSGGERQRVALARALANRPEVVLADEPTGQLDPDTAERVLDLLFEAREATDTALVVISHDRSLVPRFDDRVRLVDGRLAD